MDSHSRRAHAVSLLLILLGMMLPGTSLPAGVQQANSELQSVEMELRPARTGSPTRTDWARLIDETWGPSPLTIPQMLGVFDNFWTTIDYYFACFQDLEVDWDALRARYRPEIEGGVSRGRFAGIMNHLCLALLESHTRVDDLVVTVETPTNPGVPLMYVGGWGDNGHFGAGLTPLPDSTLLVYKAVSPHPLGLVPGDLVLGYEGVPWTDLHRELLAAELPIKHEWLPQGGRPWRWGSCIASNTHSMLMSAGMNWHLFNTIDIVKYATRDTLHLSVDPLIGQGMYLDCTEQLPVPGVPMPDYLGNSDAVGWGIVDGTQIGYIYVRAWMNNAETDFYNAVDSLMTEHQTAGLIIDFRNNYGGNMFMAYDALELLFNEEVWTIGLARRCDINNHFAMCPDPSSPESLYVIHGDPNTFYDRPIAVLVGPGAVSSGDQVANLLRFHPRTRFFGKTTATAFNAPVPYTVGYPGWDGGYARYDAYLVSDPSNYLTHDDFPVDEAVWLTRDDVVQGRDTVVEAAIAWIDATSGIAVATVAPPHALLRNIPNPFSSTTTIRFTLAGEEPAFLRVYDPVGRLVRTLVDGKQMSGEQAIAWDRTDDRRRAVAAGVYYYRLDIGGHSETRKMVVLK